jgi:hypothetical protein
MTAHTAAQAAIPLAKAAYDLAMAVATESRIDNVADEAAAPEAERVRIADANYENFAL